jgi:hypothetical protein
MKELKKKNIVNIMVIGLIVGCLVDVDAVVGAILGSAPYPRSGSIQNYRCENLKS